MNKIKLWYHHKNINKEYNKNGEPNYFSPSDYEWATYIEQQWPQISQELWALVRSRNEQLIPYFKKEADDNTQSWQTLSFRTWGIDIKSTLSQCPAVADLFARFPQLVSASINLLKAGSKINAHQGDTNGIFRCHVGLQIPASLPDCGFEVGGEKRSWQEGKMLIFCDANYHWAWNYSPKDRLIFLFDVIRDEFMPQKKQICLTVRAFLLSQLLRQRFSLLQKISPTLLLSISMPLLKTILWILYPIQQKKGVLLKHD